MEVVVAAILAAAFTVAFAEWTGRVRHRREAVEKAALELPLVVPRVLAGMGNPAEGFRTVDTSVGSAWDAERQRALELCLTIRVMAIWPMRHAARIRAAADLQMTRLGALENDYLAHGKVLTRAELTDLADVKLPAVVFGRSRPLDDQLQEARRALRKV
jgi:hypothetical protein